MHQYDSLMPLRNGALFAGYTIVRSLGSGGMGEVYLAQHPRLPRQDALKILPEPITADSEFRERFTLSRVGFVVPFCEYAIDGGTTNSERRGDSACRFTASVHPLRQSGFRLVERLWSSDRLTACPARVTSRCTTFPAQLKLQLHEAGEYASHHAISRANCQTAHRPGRSRHNYSHRPSGPRR